MRRLPLAGTLLGLALGTWLVATNDLGAIADAFGRVGALGLTAIVLLRVLILLLCGVAWGQTVRGLVGLGRAGSGAFLILRFVREGINVLLPVASVGGDVVGGRLLTFWGATGALAAASIMVDMLFQAGTQAAFALLGVGLLLQVSGEAAHALAIWVLRALAVTALLLAAFLAAQRSPGVRAAARRALAWGRRTLRGGGTDPAPGGGVYDALDAVWAPGRSGHLAASVLLHLAAWLIGAVEIGIALACIGNHSVGVAEILIIEALSQAIKSAAFPVPSGLGVQEGGFVLLGGLFGIDAGTALALSLVKRVPDVVLGLPALILWQMIEARRGTILPPQG
ncbi:lysylphosphatidylglycerol synthase domain-containing protein [Methylobacterium sp. J-068]|uniref:lysylphosphatidylglycerol synthase domain-containing protein n=1 Tax=Methylobacterium sp. J-068 TaxID=2836649 RepID=UPI001FB88696|nr:lysylphosphatidylglycerol synthase domain-containing protein [Methylobacterium sp. J-068]MCJ2037237.1 lysylphosphatidylglycerol synthase domain-containing protein [Methylobacterium sp. J-068]